MKHNPMATAHAAGLTVGVFYILCRLLVVLFPDGMMLVAKAWFHGLTLGSWDVAAGDFFIGLIASVVSAWLVGYLFAASYNNFVKK